MPGHAKIRMERALCVTLEPMSYQLGESGSSSAISSLMLIFSGTAALGDCSSSRAFTLLFREEPKNIPAPWISLRMDSRFWLQLSRSGDIWVDRSGRREERAYSFGPLLGTVVQGDCTAYEALRAADI